MERVRYQRFVMMVPHWISSALRALGLGCSFAAVLGPGAALWPTEAGSAFRLMPATSLSAAADPVGEVFRAVSRCRNTLPEAERWEIAQVVHEQSLNYGYDPLFVIAMMEIESTCSPVARGPRGSLGLIQLRPETARSVAREMGVKWGGARTLTLPGVNVRLGLRYLWKLERQFNDPYLAVAAYNLGPARVEQMSRERARGARYVRKIMARYEDLLAEAPLRRT
jgi:soluble lytic murein transglycosylase-like protein